MKRRFFPLLLVLFSGFVEGRVILLSMDGLRPDAITIHGPENVPNFYRLRAEGAFTDNARTDYHFSTTLPNHTTMVTGRPVLGRCGHRLIANFGGPTTQLHIQGYLASMFDVAHDRGLTTALLATKSKFGVFDGNYDADRGAPDAIGLDDGRDKIDFYHYGFTDTDLVSLFLEKMAEEYWDLSMVHLRTLDSIGHGFDWDVSPGSSYMEAVKTMDGYLGQILSLIDESPELAGTTHLILTTDHGGTLGTRTHIHAEVPTNYTIPFYVLGPGVLAGAELYELNPDYKNPGHLRAVINAPRPAIRNGMAGNLALQLLDLPSIPGSCLNVSQQLRVGAPIKFAALHPNLDPEGDANGNGLSNFCEYALGVDPEGVSREDVLPQMEGKTLAISRRINAVDITMGVEISADLENWYPLSEGVTYLVESSEETPEGRKERLSLPMLLGKVFFRQTFERKLEN